MASKRKFPEDLLVPAAKDRLSLLPDVLLLKILTFTGSYLSAVRCSVLSKRWKRLHTRLSNLYLFEHELRGKPIDQSNEELIEKENQKLLKDVGSVLFRHQRDVETFCLVTKSDLSMWQWCLSYICNYKLKKLFLFLYADDEDGGEDEEVPLCIFSIQTLELLHLSKFVTVKIPEEFTGFPNLTMCSLELYLNEESLWLDELLSKCPVLETLQLEIIFFENRSEPESFPFTFSSPSLKVLKLEFPLLRLQTSMVIRVDAPQLIKMILQKSSRETDEPGTSVQLRINTPRLSKLSLPKEGDVEVEFDCLPRLRKGVVTAVWIKDCHFVKCLELINTNSINDASIMKTICDFSALEILMLSKIQASTKDFWQMVLSLPLLKSLKLTDCLFDDTDVWNKEIVEETQVTRLQNVDIRTRTSTLTDGAKVMLVFLATLCPDLQRVSFAMDKNLEKKDEYFQFLLRVFSSDYALLARELSTCMDFDILKNPE